MTTTTTTSVLGDWLSTVAVSVVTLGLLLTYLSKHVQKKERNPKTEAGTERKEGKKGEGEKRLPPGPAPSHPQLGNLLDIAAAGGYYHWLKALHAQYGDVVAFHNLDKLTVSVCTPELYRSVKHAFDRPPEIFELFSPLIARQCVSFQNGAAGKRRRRAYDASFSHSAMEGFYPGFTQATLELMSEFASASSLERVPVSEWTLRFAMKCCLRECFGDYFKRDEEIVRMKDNFDFCWKELERRAAGQTPEPGSERDVIFNRRIADIKQCARALIADRKAARAAAPEAADRKFIDVVIDFGGDDAELIESDVIDYVLAAYMSTGDMMTWCTYLLATHPDVQERVYREVLHVLGPDGQLSFDTVNQLSYTKQVLDEVLRYSLLGTFTLRYAERDLTLRGFHVPADAAVIQAIGVTHRDPRLWPDPERFDPDRFSAERVAARPRYSFVPFGFCGGRQCPGFRFTYTETTILFANLVRKYRLRWSEPQATPERVYGMLTFIKDEIFVDLVERNRELPNQPEGIPKETEVEPGRPEVSSREAELFPEPVKTSAGSDCEATATSGGQGSKPEVIRAPPFHAAHLRKMAKA